MEIYNEIKNDTIRIVRGKLGRQGTYGDLVYVGTRRSFIEIRKTTLSDVRSKRSLFNLNLKFNSYL